MAFFRPINARQKKRARIDRVAREICTDGCYHRWDGETLEMLLPWPPSNNVYYRSRVVFPRHGKPFVTTYIAADGEAYRDAVRKVLADAHSFGRTRLRLAVELCGPTRQARDVKNFDKALCDVLQRNDDENFAGVYDNDAQIDDYRVVRGRVRPGGLVIVRIREIPPVLRDWTPAKLFEE